MICDDRELFINDEWDDLESRCRLSWHQASKRAVLDLVIGAFDRRVVSLGILCGEKTYRKRHAQIYEIVSTAPTWEEALDLLRTKIQVNGTPVFLDRKKIRKRTGTFSL